MKLEVGKKYFNLQHDLIEIVRYNNSKDYPFVDNFGGHYTSDGKYLSTYSDYDLVLSAPEPVDPL